MENRKMIDEIVEVADEVLNDWERTFLESLSERTNVEELSDKQQKCLEKIYQKACDSPY
jgi:hypothetical protein